MIVTVVFAVTDEEEMVKVTVLAPAGTVTVAGTPATEELELSVMTAPPAGAGPLRTIVPVELVPPWNVLGDACTPES